jgi:hypothetical protein
MPSGDGIEHPISLPPEAASRTVSGPDIEDRQEPARERVGIAGAALVVEDALAGRLVLNQNCQDVYNGKKERGKKGNA